MLNLSTGIPVTTICEMLDTINALSDNKSKIYFAGSEVEYGFMFRDACTQEQIAVLEKGVGYKLPCDYKQFLLYTNGLELLTSYISSRLCCVEEIHQIITIFDWLPNGFLPIGMCADGSICIALNMNEEGNKNVYVIYIIDDEYFRLNCDFRTFLDRFITTYGDTFWEWGATKTEVTRSEEQAVVESLLDGVIIEVF